jgi:hypothetical protein
MNGRCTGDGFKFIFEIIEEFDESLHHFAGGLLPWPLL